MGKIYLEKNVLDAALERLEYILNEFDIVCLSVSAGKDSSVMLQLANIVGQKLNKKFDVLCIDLEAQYKATIDHIEELKKLSHIRTFYHNCLPLNLMNSNSVFQPHWTCWNPEEEDIWVRKMPTGPEVINIDNHPYGDLFDAYDEFEKFMINFSKWLMKKYDKKKMACLVGIRTDESMNRFRSIAFGQKVYDDKPWSTDIGHGIYNFYPIYDWRTEDIWGAVAKLNFTSNDVYEALYKNGVSIHEQRICHPYGADQRISLDQWAALEPETWSKVVNRVSGANFGNIYCKTTLLGHNGTEKPVHMSWQEYTVFLLESLSLYSPDLTKHYVRKIKIFFDWYKKNHNIDIKDIPDELTPSVIRKTLNPKAKWIHWKRVAKCIEKNDFSCKTLAYGLTKTDIEEARNLKDSWGKLLGIQTHTKEMRVLDAEIWEEITK